MRARRGGAGRLAPYVFLAPFLLLFVAFLVAPLVYALWLSVFRDTLARGRLFVGLANYLDAVQDESLWDSVRNMLLFGAVQIPVMVGLSLLLALLLHSGTSWLRDMFRIAFFIPYAVPTVFAALIWGYLYGPAFGPATQLAHALSLPPPDFLSDRAMPFSLANIVTWEFTGYNMVILYSALQSVPRDVEEAASICGATARQIAWHIRIPLIAPAIFVVVIFSIIGTLQLFNEPQIMHAVAPEVIGDHYTPNVYAYSLAFTNQQYNYAAALSFVLGAIVAVISYVFMLAAGRRSAA